MSRENNLYILTEGFNELKRSFPHRCFECGICRIDIEDLQFAHLEPTGLSGRGRGKINRYYDIKKHPDSYYLCCETKHNELDGRGQNT